ncbi:MAG: glycoside hydrolase family 2 [Clostridia bacterium]|nr:glycoside hydrolase family 2 [Clostridia bacterium]
MSQFNHLKTYQGENQSYPPLNEYPRPALKRDSFFNLNGWWDFRFEDETKMRKILVPYVCESLLSGINELSAGRDLFYCRTFSLPQGFIKDKVLLHFGAVDQIASVHLNGTLLGTCAGGYFPFSFDITDLLREENLLEVKVEDKLDLRLPYGKQSNKRGGMWYTTCSGIWQTVWIESVPENYIESFDISCTLEQARITFKGIETGEVSVEENGTTVKYEIKDGVAVITPENPIYWSPENPHLYHFTAKSGKDEISSYFALRTLEIKDCNGVNRLCLNGEKYFFSAVLDQGYFSDGIFTPASEKSFEEDILAMKRLGFNTLRKHIKVEPQIFYYLCDKLGMVVFQDMINNSTYSFLRDTALPTIGLKRLNDKFLHRNKISRKNFISSMVETVNLLKNHPCICLWTIFNEGWGQFEATKAYRLLKSMDSSRFIDSASGWFACCESDVESLHIYFKKLKAKKSDKPIIISEFGGYALSLKDHVFNENNEYGYSKYTDISTFNEALERLFEEELLPLIKSGVCASVYTQLSDVEDETNGLLTYDRKICKASDSFAEINKMLYEEIKK